MDDRRFPRLVCDLYRTVAALERMSPGRPFTPDGHMVGSLGECLVAYHYGVELTRCSTKGCDARRGRRQIEIKATQGDCVAFRCCPPHLIVIRLERDGTFEESYNGPGEPVWDLVKHKPRPSNGQYQIRLSTLRRLMKDVPLAKQIQRVK